MIQQGKDFRACWEEYENFIFSRRGRNYFKNTRVQKFVYSEAAWIKLKTINKLLRKPASNHEAP